MEGTVGIVFSRQVVADVQGILVEAGFLFFFFNDTATTEIYTLSLHDALPISHGPGRAGRRASFPGTRTAGPGRSEEHTSELQSRLHLVCRLLLEKKNKVRRPRARRTGFDDARSAKAAGDGRSATSYRSTKERV